MTSEVGIVEFGKVRIGAGLLQKLCNEESFDEAIIKADVTANSLKVMQ